MTVFPCLVRHAGCALNKCTKEGGREDGHAREAMLPYGCGTRIHNNVIRSHAASILLDKVYTSYYSRQYIEASIGSTSAAATAVQTIATM